MRQSCIFSKSDLTGISSFSCFCFLSIFPILILVPTHKREHMISVFSCLVYFTRPYVLQLIHFTANGNFILFFFLQLNIPLCVYTTFYLFIWWWISWLIPDFGYHVNMVVRFLFDTVCSQLWPIYPEVGVLDHRASLFSFQ